MMIKIKSILKQDLNRLQIQQILNIIKNNGSLSDYRNIIRELGRKSVNAMTNVQKKIMKYYANNYNFSEYQCSSTLNNLLPFVQDAKIIKKKILYANPESIIIDFLLLGRQLDILNKCGLTNKIFLKMLHNFKDKDDIEYLIQFFKFIEKYYSKLVNSKSIPYIQNILSTQIMKILRKKFPQLFSTKYSIQQLLVRIRNFDQSSEWISKYLKQLQSVNEQLLNQLYIQGYVIPLLKIKKINPKLNLSSIDISKLIKGSKQIIQYIGT